MAHQRASAHLGEAADWLGFGKLGYRRPGEIFGFGGDGAERIAILRLRVSILVLTVEVAGEI